MHKSLISKVAMIAFVALLIGTMAMPVLMQSDAIFAQDGSGAAETPTAEPPTPTTPPVDNPPVDNPPDAPQEIPEPLTVILFGTGLAALSASVASRRKKQE